MILLAVPFCWYVCLLEWVCVVFAAVILRWHSPEASILAVWGLAGCWAGQGLAGWAGQDANGNKTVAVAPIERLQTSARRPRFLQAGGWLAGWAGQDANGNKAAAVAPKETLQTSARAGWLGWPGC